jgi:hypothetical protein
VAHRLQTGAIGMRAFGHEQAEGGRGEGAVRMVLVAMCVCVGGGGG